jgi:hypothetical protein
MEQQGASHAISHVPQQELTFCDDGAHIGLPQRLKYHPRQLLQLQVPRSQ